MPIPMIAIGTRSVLQKSGELFPKVVVSVFVVMFVFLLSRSPARGTGQGREGCGFGNLGFAIGVRVARGVPGGEEHEGSDE